MNFIVTLSVTTMFKNVKKSIFLVTVSVTTMFIHVKKSIFLVTVSVTTMFMHKNKLALSSPLPAGSAKSLADATLL